MKSYNHVILVGHLAADPELKSTKNGKNVASFPVATNRNAINDEGKKQEVADFHRIVAWQRLGDISSKYLKKGTPVLIDGRLVNHSFEDSKGKTHYRTEIVADSLRMLNSRRSTKGENAVSVEDLPGVEEKELVA